MRIEKNLTEKKEEKIVPAKASMNPNQPTADMYTMYIVGN